MRVPYYTAELDGSLEEYLETHDGFNASPLFLGSEAYRLLWDEGWLRPGMSVIRLMWNIGRDDEHFVVVDRDTIRGVGGDGRHAGREGVFKIEDIFDRPQLLNYQLCFEVSGFATSDSRQRRLNLP